MEPVTPAHSSSAAAERIRAATAGEPVGGSRAPALPDPEREYVTIKQAMTMGGVTRRTVMGWFERGLLQRFKAPNGYFVLIDKLELESYLTARRTRTIEGEPRVEPRVIDGEPVWD